MKRLRFKQFLTERNQLSKTGEESLLSVSEYYGVKPRAEAFEGEEHETRAATLEGYRIVRKDDLVMNYMLAWKGAYGTSNYDGCQIASKHDPLFASNNDPLWMAESRVWTGLGSVMGIGQLERLERREGVARPEFQPLQMQILLSADRRVNCGF